MKNILLLTKPIALTLILSILFTSCASTTVFHTVPSEAKLYLNEEFVGTTPYNHTDTKIVGTTTLVRIEKDGYSPLYTTFSRNEEADVGAIIGGFILLAPFLWTMKYKPSHTYELLPIDENQVPLEIIDYQDDTFLKADKLRELKQLLDENIITQEEFDIEKKKILE